MASLKCYKSFEETREQEYYDNRYSYDHKAGMFKGNQYHEHQQANNHGRYDYDQTNMNKTHCQTMAKTQCPPHCGCPSHSQNMTNQRNSSRGNGGMGRYGTNEKNYEQSNGHGHMAMGLRRPSNGDGGMSLDHSSSRGNGGMACTERRTKTMRRGIFKLRDGDGSCSDGSSGSGSDSD